MTIDRTDDVSQSVEDGSSEQNLRDRSAEDILEAILIELRIQTMMMQEAFDLKTTERDLEEGI